MNRNQSAMTARTRATWLLRWLVSAGMLAWIFTRPELAQLGPHLRQVNLWWVLGGLLCAGLTLALSAWRWQACLHGLGLVIPLATVVKITLAAAAAGWFSFGSLGTDLARVLLAGRYLPGRHPAILSSLAMDHTSALPCVVLVLWLALRDHGAMPVIHLAAGWLVLAVVAAMALTVALARWRFMAFHLKVMRLLADPAIWRGFVLAVWWSLPVWLTFCGSYYCAARAFGVVVPAAGFAGVIAIADGVASLPITIAGLGVREQAFQSLLGRWYGVAPAAAVALSLTGFSLSLVWAAVGAVCFGGALKTPAKVIP